MIKLTRMDYKDKKVLVIGLARSGMAAIKVLYKLGAKITVSIFIKPPNAFILMMQKWPMSAAS